MPAKTRPNVRAMVTDVIVKALEAGVTPWVRPWTGGTAFPVNGVSGRRYTGTNVFLLWMAATMYGYTSNKWYTFNQARAAGAMVKKGEHGQFVVYASVGEIRRPKECPKCKRKGITVKDAGKQLRGSCGCTFYPPTYRTLRYFTVFNAEQIDGLPVEPETPRPAGDENVDAYLTTLGASYTESPMGRACYSPMRDTITLPPRASFRDGGSFYGTLLHEVGHWTGHATRCDRPLHNFFGTPEYAMEELVAELYAAFMCAELGVEGSLQHPEYIGAWIKKLKDDDGAFFRAVADATVACEWSHFIVGYEAAD
jgi:antirestriction protein ArdC